MADVDVVSALTCPYCLGRPAHALVSRHGEGATVACACALCELEWSVAPDPAQAQRLVAAPPPGLSIQGRFIDSA
jgi:hypothetical protein